MTSPRRISLHARTSKCKPSPNYYFPDDRKERVEDSLTPDVIASPGLLFSMKPTYTIITSIE